MTCAKREKVNYWLIKSEPDDYSIEDLAEEEAGTKLWKGIRTEQSNHILRDQVQTGDLALFFHNNCVASGIAGVVEVLSSGYPCPHQYQADSELYEPRATKACPIWYVIDIGLVKRFDHVLSVPKLKATPVLQDMALLKKSRLAIQPVAPKEWEVIMKLAE